MIYIFDEIIMSNKYLQHFSLRFVPYTSYFIVEPEGALKENIQIFSPDFTFGQTSDMTVSRCDCICHIARRFLDRWIQKHSLFMALVVYLCFQPQLLVYDIS